MSKKNYFFLSLITMQMILFVYLTKYSSNKTTYSVKKIQLKSREPNLVDQLITTSISFYNQSNLIPDTNKNEKNKMFNNDQLKIDTNSSKNLKLLIEKRYKENNFNVIASDLIGLNRNLSDFRPER